MFLIEFFAQPVVQDYGPYLIFIAVVLVVIGDHLHQKGK